MMMNENDIWKIGNKPVLIIQNQSLDKSRISRKYRPSSRACLVGPSWDGTPPRVAPKKSQTQALEYSSPDFREVETAIESMGSYSWRTA
jgi:hypothetical protein